MKINIEIADDSNLVEALAAEISKSKAASVQTETETEVGDEEFELKRPMGPSRLTCVCFSCGI